MSKHIYIVDIDSTILYPPPVGSNYVDAFPIPGRIEKINQLYDEGNTIIYWTARGATTGIDWTEFTKKQLDGFGCKYTEIRMHKPHYHFWIDDKAINANDFFN